jgi:hypothetical protein
MSDISQSILQQLGVKSSLFSISSRYNGTEMASMEGNNGETINYLRRRFVPPSERFFTIQEHRVKEGERIDNITAQYLGDPERYWQICDANDVIDPGKLAEEPGDKIKITLPEGIPGNSNA